VYRRADLSRTMKLVLALFLTAAATSVSAREFRAADTRNESYPTLQAPHDMGSTDPVEPPYKQVLTGIITTVVDGADNDWSFERIRKVQ
jgi:hypothetical protein